MREPVKVGIVGLALRSMEENGRYVRIAHVVDDARKRVVDEAAAA